MNSPTIFVIDDQPSVRDAIGEMLSVFGFTVEIFNSAAAFLDKVPANRPGCVVADVRMPGMDGIALVGEMARAADRNSDHPDFRARRCADGRRRHQGRRR